MLVPSDSIAARISSVLGFIVCPPDTTQLTPRLSKTCAIPGPGATATAAIWPGTT